MKKEKQLILIVFLLVFSRSKITSQDTTSICDYKDCIEYLERVKPALKMDSIGDYGIRLSVVETLIKNKCIFINDLLPAFLYYFGEPNMVLDYSKITNHKEFIHNWLRLTYFLKIIPDRNKVGQKYLYIFVGNDGRITDFKIVTVEE